MEAGYRPVHGPDVLEFVMEVEYPFKGRYWCLRSIPNRVYLIVENTF